jgi:hypothetical protein
MQIHEITKLTINEGIGSYVGGLVGGAQAKASALGQKLSGSGEFSASRKDPVRQQQIKMLADKSLGAWRAYEKELLKSNPDARESGMYEQALLAFVTKNLLGGQYLPNVINKNQIVALVKQLSSSGNVTEEEKITGAAKPGLPTDAERANLQQRIAAATTAQQAKSGTPAAPGTTNSPAAPAATTPATATPDTATPDTAPSKPMSPQQQNELWLKLVQQAVIAQPRAPGGQTQTPADADKDDGTQPAGDARSYQQQLTKDMDAAVVRGLPLFGNTAIKNTGNNNVQSTGNPVADALLLMAGFRGI